MQSVIQLASLMFASLGRDQAPSPIDFHWLGSLTDNSVVVKFVPKP